MRSSHSALSFASFILCDCPACRVGHIGWPGAIRGAGSVRSTRRCTGAKCSNSPSIVSARCETEMNWARRPPWSSLSGLVANKDQSVRYARGDSLERHVWIAPFRGTRFVSEIGQQRDFNSSRCDYENRTDVSRGAARSARPDHARASSQSRGAASTWAALLHPHTAQGRLTRCDMVFVTCSK